MDKKILSIIITVCLALASVLSISGCSFFSINPLNVKEAYKMAITAGVSYLQGNSIASTKLLSTASQTVGERPTALKNEIDNLSDYIGMFEGYLADTSKDSIATTNDISSEIGMVYGDYTITENTIKMSFSMLKIDNTTENYFVYYTETLIDNSGYVEADDDDEQEVNASLDGVAIVNEQIYSLSGNRKTETEFNEYECELNFIISFDDSNYVKMEYSTENEDNEQENKFEFSVYNNGVKISKTSIELETEDGESQMSLKFVETNQSKIIYKIKRKTVNGKDIIVVKYSLNGENGSIEIDYENGIYTYNYSNGFSETIEK